MRLVSAHLRKEFFATFIFFPTLINGKSGRRMIRLAVGKEQPSALATSSVFKKTISVCVVGKSFVLVLILIIIKLLIIQIIS